MNSVQGHLQARGLSPDHLNSVAGVDFLKATARVESAVRNVHVRVGAESSFGMKRVVRPGLEVKLKAKSAQEEKAAEIFARIKDVVALKVIASPADQARFKLVIDPDRRIGRWRLEDGGTETEIFLGDIPELRVPLQELYETVHGRAAPEVMPNINGRVDEEHAPRLPGLPNTVEAYAKKRAGIDTRAMQKAETLKEEIISTLSSKRLGKLTELETAKGKPIRDYGEIERLQHEIQFLQHRIQLFTEADMYAVYTTLLHNGDSTKIKKDLEEVERVNKQVWYKRGKTTPFSREQEMYLARVAALNLRDPIEYLHHCERYNLNHAEQMAVEQMLIAYANSDDTSSIEALFEGASEDVKGEINGILHPDDVSVASSEDSDDASQVGDPYADMPGLVDENTNSSSGDFLGIMDTVD